MSECSRTHASGGLSGQLVPPDVWACGKAGPLPTLLPSNPEPGHPGSPGFVMPSMTVHPVSRRVWLLASAAIVACFSSGCTTVLSTASLRDLFMGLDDRVDDSEIPIASGDNVSARNDDDDSADAERRAAAIEEAISRLSKIENLDDAARATLIATLQRTDQEDWPVVVDAFAESLADAPSAHVVAKADLDSIAVTTSEPLVTVPMEVPSAPEPVPAPVPAPAPVPEETAKPVAEPVQPAEVMVATSGSPAPETEAIPEPVTPRPPTLVIRNAAFASRVQAWGVLDRFAANRFRSGQEVIVYFELEGLSAGESATGHTTCIDSRLRLVTSDGEAVHDWTFEPIAETCRARRHDYFARYLVRIPAEAKPGRHRVELAVTDTLSGQVAVEAIDLEILAAPPTAE